MAVHSISSQAGAESSGENSDDLEDGFSELEGPTDAIQEGLSGDENIDDQLISEEDAAATYMDNVFLEIGTEVDVGEKNSSKTRATSLMTEAILAAAPLTIHKVLDKWVEEGKEVTRKEVTSTFLHLRKRKLFLKALKVLF